MNVGKFKKFLALCGYPQQYAGGSSTPGNITLVAQSFTAPVNVTGTTAETTVATVTLTAGTLKAGGRLQIYAPQSLGSGRTGTCQVKVYVGGSLAAQVSLANTIGSNSLLVDLLAQTGSILVAMPYTEGSGGATQATAIAASLAVDQTIRISMTNSVSGDSVTSLGYSIQVTNP